MLFKYLIPHRGNNLDAYSGLEYLSERIYIGKIYFLFLLKLKFKPIQNGKPPTNLNQGSI